MRFDTEGRTMEVEAKASGQHAATRDPSRNYSLSVAVWLSSLPPSTPSFFRLH